MGLGDRQEQFETGLPLPCLQAGEGALRDSGQCGELSQGEASAEARLLQPRADSGEDCIDRCASHTTEATPEFPETATNIAAAKPLGHRRAMETATYDVAVIGGGAAGLSAALVLGRARRRVVVIDAGAPRNAPAAHVQGFLSRDGMPPADLLALARDEVRGYGAEIVEDEVVEVEAGFTLRLAGGDSVTARRLLLTIGAVDELPDIPGARERWGRDFLHCPYCHGWEVRDEAIGVLGTDPGSIDHAQLLRQWSDDIVVFSHSHSLTADERAALDARGIGVIEGTVTALSVANDQLNGVELSDGRVVPRAAVFMRPSLRPQGEALIESLGCQVGEDGFVRADATGRTSVSGVWVAGNASNPRAQVITAAGEGSAAAIAINTDLVREDVQTALHAKAQSAPSGASLDPTGGIQR